LLSTLLIRHSKRGSSRLQLLVLEDRLPPGDALLGALLGASLVSSLAALDGPLATRDAIADLRQSHPGADEIARLVAATTPGTLDATSQPLVEQVQDQTPAQILSGSYQAMAGTGFASGPNWTQLPALATASARVSAGGLLDAGHSRFPDMSLQAAPGASARDAGLGLTPSFAGVPPAALPVPEAEVAGGQPMPAPASVVRQNYGQLPLSFEANVGQAEAQVQYLAHGAGYSLFLTATEAVMALSPPQGAANGGQAASLPAPQAETLPAVVHMQVLGGNTTAQVVGLDPLPGKVNYFLGNDPSQWRTNVSTYAKVEYQDVYPGISLDYYGRQDQVEYDFVAAPGADPRVIQLGFTGAAQVSLDSQGDLVLHAGGQDIVQHKPVVYQDVNGSRQAVAGSFVLRDDPNAAAMTTHQIGFTLGNYDVSRPLVIDPVLSYSTYLGGSGYDGGTAIAVDAAGNAYVTGNTTSTDFPTANAFQSTKRGPSNTSNAFVTKFSADGTRLVYSTYLGGSGSGAFLGDGGSGIAVDAAGNSYVTGYTGSTDFPTAHAFQPTKGGPSSTANAFVTKLSVDGASLVYSTYLGGSGRTNPGDFGNGIVVDTAGNAYVTGVANSPDFPTANAFQPTRGGPYRNAFVTKFSADGASLVYSTYLGGSGSDNGVGIAVDAAGSAYVTGNTTSTNFPTAHAFQPSKGSDPSFRTAFVTKFSADGASLVYSTYLGGSLDGPGNGIAVGGDGNAYVTGWTDSIDFPTANAFQPTNGATGGIPNAFVTKFSADGASLVYSTYLGGSGNGRSGDVGGGIAVDATGNAYVTGSTYSTDFPTANALQPTKGGPSNTSNAFVTKFTADGASLAYSTYLGGSGGDGGSGIAVDATGNAYVTGGTSSTDFPTANAFQPIKGGPYSNAFVTKIARKALPSPSVQLSFWT
jgi:hypothetical protein